MRSEVSRRGVKGLHEDLTQTGTRQAGQHQIPAEASERVQECDKEEFHARCVQLCLGRPGKGYSGWCILAGCFPGGVLQSLCQCWMLRKNGGASQFVLTLSDSVQMQSGKLFCGASLFVCRVNMLSQLRAGYLSGQGAQSNSICFSSVALARARSCHHVREESKHRNPTSKGIGRSPDTPYHSHSPSYTDTDAHADPHTHTKKIFSNLHRGPDPVHPVDRKVAVAVPGCCSSNLQQRTSGTLRRCATP